MDCDHEPQTIASVVVHQRLRVDMWRLRFICGNNRANYIVRGVVGNFCLDFKSDRYFLVTIWRRMGWAANGLSMGGMIGMWLGVNAPERLDPLVLCNTAAKIGTTATWNTRISNCEGKGNEVCVEPYRTLVHARVSCLRQS